MSYLPVVTPDQYANRRATPLGSSTERLEHDLVFELAGLMSGTSLLDAGTGDGSYAIEAAAKGESFRLRDARRRQRRASGPS